MGEADKLTKNYKVANARFRVNIDRELPLKFWGLQEDILEWKSIKLKVLPSKKYYLGWERGGLGLEMGIRGKRTGCSYVFGQLPVV